MRRYSRNRIKERIARTICSLLAAIFCMLAGAAGYHQLMITEAQAAEKKEPELDTLETPEEKKPAPTVSSQIIIYHISANTAFISQYNASEPEQTFRQEDITLLAACVEAEAGNQPLLGKRLVADVILNRVDSDRFPDTISGVIRQPGQFSVVRNGALKRAVPSDHTMKAVYMELNSRSCPDIYFFNCGDYLNFGKPWQQIGDHYFSTF